MTSNVGSASVYEAGDQRNAPESEKNNANRFHEGKKNSHKGGDSSMFHTLVRCWSEYKH